MELFFRPRIPAPEKKKKKQKQTSTHLDFELDGDYLVRAVYCNVTKSIPTATTEPFTDGLTAVLSKESPTVDLAIISRMPGHALRFEEPVSLRRGKHTITICNRSTYILELDVVLFCIRG